MKQATNPEQNWYNLAHQILVACKPLAKRVIDEGIKLMLTDTDWSVLEGFEIVLNQSDQAELLSLCLSAGLSRKEFDSLLDLYNFKKRS